MKLVKSAASPDAEFLFAISNKGIVPFQPY